MLSEGWGRGASVMGEVDKSPLPEHSVYFLILEVKMPVWWGCCEHPRKAAVGKTWCEWQYYFWEYILEYLTYNEIHLLIFVLCTQVTQKPISVSAQSSPCGYLVAPKIYKTEGYILHNPKLLPRLPILGNVINILPVAQTKTFGDIFISSLFLSLFFSPASIALSPYYVLGSNVLNLLIFCKLRTFSSIKTFSTPILKLLIFLLVLFWFGAMSTSSNHTECIVMQEGMGRGKIRWLFQMANRLFLCHLHNPLINNVTFVIFYILVHVWVSLWMSLLLTPLYLHITTTTLCELLLHDLISCGNYPLHHHPPGTPFLVLF